MTYKEAYNKIIDAYFKDEIQPMDCNFCFCGTLSPDGSWHTQLVGKYPYSPKEFSRMEFALLDEINPNDSAKLLYGMKHGLSKKYEQDLFSGMCAALDVLKQIHKERGENVDDVPEFTKRILTDVV